MAELTVINLGCGKRKSPSEIGIDLYPESLADVLADLGKDLPLADNSAGKVIAEDVLEHVPDLVKVMEEIHRILVPGGKLTVVAPYFAHPDAFRDPTHRRFFTWGSFDYFVLGRKPAEYTSVSFRYLQRSLEFPGGFWGRLGKLIFRFSPRRYEKYYARRFPARSLHLELEAVGQSG